MERMESRSVETLCEIALIILCALLAMATLARCFFGTEITDEAFYVSDAVTMMHGNLLYAYENYFKGSGFTLLMVPFIFIFEIFSPQHTGLMLYMRICFVLSGFVMLWAAYQILKKSFRKADVLLMMCIMIPYSGGGTGIFNFSYNTIPCMLIFLSAVLLYDTIERGVVRKKFRLFLIGLFMGIAFMAHPVSSVAIGIFTILILIRSPRTEKITNLLLCIAGGVGQALIVSIPIIAQAGLSIFIAGIRNLLSPYPVQPKESYVSQEKRFHEIQEQFESYWNQISIPFLITLGALILIILALYLSHRIKRNALRELIVSAALLAWGIALSFLIYDIGQGMTDQSTAAYYRNWPLGIVGAMGILGLVCVVYFYREPFLFYVGLYPGLFALILAVETNDGANVSRFSATVPALAVFVLLMLNREFKPLRALAGVMAIYCGICICLHDYAYVYRDAKVNELTASVTDGVYSGLRTTEARARDLPELEAYLNQYVSADEYYAFRDNVPAGYLMMHQGKMCDRATWDCLQYSYKRNAPDNLYAYYQRRGQIPDKIIYVNFGRDDILSIETEDYLYNEFVNAYYTRIADTELNETFKHVIVFEYSGGFDGNLDDWIERHMYHPEEKQI